MIFNLLVVDSNGLLPKQLEKYLEPQCYRLMLVIDAEQMWYEFNRQNIDLVILNLTQIGVDSLHIVRELRAKSHVGIVLMSSNIDAIDKIIGLEMGADEYVTKPFEMRELTVRIRNLLWRMSLVRQAEVRVAKQLSQQDNLMCFDGYELDLNSRKLQLGETLIKLTKAEFELLVVFALHPQQVLSRQRLMNQTSHRNQDVNDRTIDVIIRRLRNKMASELFVTVHGEGYLFAPNICS